MDIVKRALQTYQAGFEGWVKDLEKIGPNLQTLWHEVVNFDFRNADLTGANVSGLILGFVVTGFFIMAVIANLMPDTKPEPIKENRALGADSVAKQKPGAPPIPPPTEIISMRVYPIKSCRGIEFDLTRLRKTGLTLDRNWMFIDKAERKFMTIRQEPSMTLIDTNITEKDGAQHLEISIHGTDGHVQVPAFPSEKWLKENTTLSNVEIWEQDTDGWEYGPEINKIFSEFFNKDVALVYKGPQPRNVAVNGSEELYGQKQNHHFADVMSLQIASEASIKDLNRRLKHKEGTPDALTIERFRPNIIIRGRDEKPWEEDTWKRIRITTVMPEVEALYKLDLDVVARCARCQVPNVNPDTAEKHPKQPWDELMKFRRVDKGSVAKYKPCFGMLCIPKNEGFVKVGSTLEVLETTDQHLYNTARFADL